MLLKQSSPLGVRVPRGIVCPWILALLRLGVDFGVVGQISNSERNRDLPMCFQWVFLGGVVWYFGGRGGWLCVSRGFR